MKNVKQLDALRGIAALLVVLFHMKPFLEYLFPGRSGLFDGGAYLGVSVFFIISGFVMGAATQSDDRIAAFILKRVFRVYVPAVVATLIYLFIHGGSIDIQKVLKLIPDGGAGPYYGYGLYFITWTLVYEILFYLIFATSMFISWRHRIEISATVILLNVFVLQYAITGDVSVGVGDVAPVTGSAAVALSFLINPINLLFVIGLIWYRSYDLIRPFVLRLRQPVFTSIIGLAGVIIAYGFFSAKGHGIFQMGFYSIILFSLAMFIHYRQEGVTKYSLGGSGLLWLGKISYSLYLCHYLAIDMRKYYLAPFEGVNLCWHVVVVFVAITFVTLAFYCLVDRPTHRAGVYLARKLAMRRRTSIANSSASP